MMKQKYFNFCTHSIMNLIFLSYEFNVFIYNLDYIINTSLNSLQLFFKSTLHVQNLLYLTSDSLPMCL